MRLPRAHAIPILLLSAFGCARADSDDAQTDFAVDSGHVRMDDGVRLFYKTIGDGETNVVIPMGLFLEEALRPLAASDRRLVFYDPRARGRSDAGDRRLVTLARQVADLDALRAGLGIDSMAVIGWSGLGMETAVYTMRNPARVTRLVQVAPVAARDSFNAQAYRVRLTRTDTAAVSALRRRRESGDLADDVAFCRAMRAITSRASFADPSHATQNPDVCGYPNELPDSLSGLFGPLLRSFQGYDWRNSIRTLDVPRLVIHGSADAFPLQGSREWVPPGSNARLLVIDSAGHFPYLERPDVFFPAVDAFLRGDSSGG